MKVGELEIQRIYIVNWLSRAMTHRGGNYSLQVLALAHRQKGYGHEDLGTEADSRILRGLPERKQLNDARDKGIPWKEWGSYVSDWQRGTVREDYSQDGNAWDYFSHDQARSRAYRWWEDGIAGISDD